MLSSYADLISTSYHKPRASSERSGEVAHTPVLADFGPLREHSGRGSVESEMPLARVIQNVPEVLIGRAAVLVFGRGACAKCEASFLSPAAEVDLATRTTGFRSTEVALTALPARLIFLLMPGEDPL